MIVRIATEGQYRIDDDIRDRLNELDNAAVDAVDAGDEDAFRECFDELLALIRNEGSRLDGDELVGSEIIFPPPDVTFAEASRDFVGEGLIPD